jgi:hypothetical protein
MEYPECSFTGVIAGRYILVGFSSIEQQSRLQGGVDRIN